MDTEGIFRADHYVYASAFKIAEYLLVSNVDPYVFVMPYLPPAVAIFLFYFITIALDIIMSAYGI